ncbi:transposase [Lactiplantibacillus plantarum]|nr:hypothetical protein CFP57_03435 [Lactiplantibacillus plantarum]QGY61010.1 hypothetical protein GPJ69_01740 [Lactiplantibacillus plantarum]QLQ50400.1 transposase [Lactiplantibacillus plantarum]TFE57358.1 hypothetical protein E3O64_02665 [Lactiplantibacillus plantarum]
MDKTNSHSFLANTFRLLLSAAAYNMVLALKKRFTYGKTVLSTHNTPLDCLSHPCGCQRHTRRYILKLSSNNVFDEVYWSILTRIRCLTQRAVLFLNFPVKPRDKSAQTDRIALNLSCRIYI